MRIATLVAIGAAGCASGNAPAGAAADAAPATDAPRAIDAVPGVDAAPDAAPDASADAAPGCAISAGTPMALDGNSDLAKYPAAQQVAPGAMLGADGVGIAWDASRLYVTVASTAFEGEYEPLHVYVQAGADLAAAVPATGKEYSGLAPALPFTPTHLIAARRTNGADSYDGVWLPDAGWTARGMALAPGADVMVAADHHALSVQVPWAALGGCPTALRLAVHVVHAQAANEWKDLVPASSTPWMAPGGGYYEVDLTGASAVSGWALR